MSKEQTTARADPEDEFWGGIWWVKAYDAFGIRSATPGECANEIQRLRLAQKGLLRLYQDKLVDAINDPRHFDGERSGLRMAAAMFRGCLEELEIQNVE